MTDTNHDSLTYDELSLRDLLRTDPVTLDAIPEVYALYRDHDWYDGEPAESDGESGAAPRGEVGVVAWVFALPDGNALMLSAGEGQRTIWHTDLERASGFWADLIDANLTAVRAAT